MSAQTIHPISIGREFIRQYYTILNGAPQHLHCFYYGDSIFVHDSVDVNEPKTISLVGKSEIENALKELASNYQDCYTEIRQIEASATLNDGVLIQVYGDLSINGEPMRPFSQTFVLANKSKNKYYVHNDIFRYQDIDTGAVRSAIDEQCQSQSKQLDENPSCFQQTEEPLAGCQPLIDVNEQTSPQSITILVNAENGEALESETIELLPDANNNVLEAMVDPPKKLDAETETIPIESPFTVDINGNALKHEFHAEDAEQEEPPVHIPIDCQDPNPSWYQPEDQFETEPIIIKEKPKLQSKAILKEPKTFADLLKFSKNFKISTLMSPSASTPLNDLPIANNSEAKTVGSMPQKRRASLKFEGEGKANGKSVGRNERLSSISPNGALSSASGPRHHQSFKCE